MDTAAPDRQRHDTSVSMRMSRKTKTLIERAAATANKSFSAFVIESAHDQAIDVLLDETVFNLSAEEAEAFAKVLDDPPPPTAKLKSLMRSKAPWE
ncbi:MAG TPA: DUF1778 domain-containing protein [Sphingomicrobium sp.]|nr:DUF1778 domain-containing protein [Sphingomicrobium sp.]